ncbi:MAG: M20/M25/M40 family metallo-hydrolase [Armatimonadetes bacterium]|nr:M20/M25/M40 family metallo-hydrolase [Armatimonadota bacterium]MDW8122924.1 M20/M25/M40 family metallo-hydrolase [Armatimonadota bacterium]
MEGTRAQLIVLLETLIRTATPTGQEKNLFPFLSQFLESRGFKVDVVPAAEVHPLTPPGEYANLVARRGETDLLISAHLDTYPGDEGCSYELKVDGDCAFGRGVVDVKGQIAALLVAVSQTDAPCLLGFVCDEEKGGAGSRSFDLNVPWALVLEPTEFGIVVAHAGAVEVSVSFTGKSAHGSVPDKGDNAIEKALAFVDALRTHPYIAHQRHPLFRSRQLMTIGRLVGGHDVMLVPDRSSLNLDIRVLPGYSAARVREIVSEVANRFKANLVVDDEAEPTEIPHDTLLTKALQDACERTGVATPGLVGYPSWTDAVNYIQKGMTSVVFGAGDLSVAHTEREHVSITDLLRLADVLKEVIQSWKPFEGPTDRSAGPR